MISAKPSGQCAKEARKANSTFGTIRRTIVTRDKDAVLRLYKSLVMPVGIPCTGTESLLETGHGKTGDV